MGCEDEMGGWDGVGCEDGIGWDVMNNCSNLSPSPCVLKRLPNPSGQCYKHVERISVACVHPRTSTGITDL